MAFEWESEEKAPQTERLVGAAANFPRGVRRAVLGLSAFAALSCLAGGVELMIWRTGNRYLPETDALQHTPFSDFRLPGLILASVVGGAQLLCLVLVYRRARAAPLTTLCAGGILTGWIIAESAMLRDMHVLHGVYLATGLLLLTFGVLQALRSGDARARWVVLVTAGELLGFAFPAVTGILLAKRGASGTVEVVSLGLAGAIEGLLLGSAQARAWPLPVRRVRYASLTALAAGLVWTSVMSLMQFLVGAEMPSTPLLVLAGLVGVLGLLSIGAAQWIELRHHAERAWRFIVWSALAWLLALPLSFAPGPFVDATTPFASQLALWSLGGWLMAAVMAFVTWRGVRQLRRSATTPARSDVR